MTSAVPRATPRAAGSRHPAAAIRCYLSAGEPSGDAHAAEVLTALRAAAPGTVAEGMGGPAMARAGAAVTAPIDGMARIGLAEAVHSLPAHYRHLSAARRAFTAGRYDVAVLVDYPGFHLRVARAAGRADVPVLAYVAPQLWAWGAGRIRRMRRDIDHVAAILPFEDAYFNARGVPTTFVGHPLLDRPPPPTRAAARAALGLHAGGPVLGVFPGSRVAEIGRLWPPFRDAALTLRRAIPDLRVVVAARPVGDYPGAEPFIVHGTEPDTVMAAADAVLVKSGTCTLEAVLAGTPMVIAYRLHPLTHAIARRLVRCTHVGLVNIVAGRTVAPEFLQDAATPERLASALLPLFDRHGPAVVAQREGFAEVRAALGTPGAARRVADLALELARRGSP